MYVYDNVYSVCLLLCHVICQVLTVRGTMWQKRQAVRGMLEPLTEKGLFGL